MLWDLLYFMDWMIYELQELEEELVQEELRRELEELGYVGYMEHLDSPDWMNALDLELYMANHILTDNLMLH
jgi:hypothetical protein